jgi:hypothetical protein
VTWRDIRHLLLLAVLASAGFEFVSQGAWFYSTAMFASMFLVQWVRYDARVKALSEAEGVVLSIGRRPRRRLH